MEEIKEQKVKEYKFEQYRYYKRIRSKIKMALSMSLYDPFALNEYLITLNTVRDTVKIELRSFYEPMPFAKNEYGVARVDCYTIPKHIIYSKNKRDFFVEALKDIGLYDEMINVGHIDFYRFEDFENRYRNTRWYRLIEKDYMAYCIEYFMDHGLEIYTDQLTEKSLIRLAEKGVIELPFVEYEEITEDKEITGDDDDLPF